MVNKLLYTWDKVKPVDAAYLSTYSEALIFDVNKRTLWHKGRQFGNAYYMTNDAVGGETFNDFRTNTAMGAYSHAEGSYSAAKAFASHSEGYNVNVAAVFSHGEGTNNRVESIAIASHTEGCANTAWGAYSHVEGCRSVTFGNQSHAEGYETSAYGNASHSEGYDTATYGFAAHAEGSNTVAYYKGTHSEGIATYAFQEGSHTEGTYTSAYGIASHTEGTYTVTYGEAGHAEGVHTTAKHKGAHSEGGFTYAEQEYSHTEGLRTASYAIGGHAEGVFTYIATGKTGAHAEGGYNVTYGMYSHVEGVYNVANEIGTHAEGGYTVAGVNYDDFYVGQYAHAEGYGSKAGTTYGGVRGNGFAAHAEGIVSQATGRGAHSEGAYTIALRDNTHAEGAYTSAQQTNSHTEGYYTKSNGFASHAEGSYTQAGADYYGDNSGHAEGYGTRAGFAYRGDRVIICGAHSEGFVTTAWDIASHSEGCYTYAMNIGAHSEGAYTYANGTYSHAGGLLTYALGIASTACGIGTVANEPGSLSIGSYNLAYTLQGRDIGSTLFAIGNGTSYTARHNLLGIHNGAYLGDGHYGNYRMIFNGDVDSYSICASSYITAYNTITAENDVVINDIVTLTTKQPAEYVDLGLPSGTLWGTQNAGGDTTRYFQWAETDGYVISDIPKRTSFSWGDYKYCKGTNQTFTKYCNVSNYGYNGFTDSLTVLEAIDDTVAKSCIDGVAATIDQANELLSNTNVYLIKADGTEIHGTLYGSAVVWDTTPDITELLSGVEFRSKTDANVKIFVPASGGIYERNTATIGHAGGFWLADLGSMPYSGKALYFDNSVCTCTDMVRAYGCPFRAVKSGDSKDVYASLPLSGGVLATKSSIDSLRSETALVTMTTATTDYDEWETIVSG